MTSFFTKILFIMYTGDKVSHKEASLKKNESVFVAKM